MFHVFSDLVRHGLRGVGIEQCRLYEPDERDRGTPDICPAYCERLAAALAGVEVFIADSSDLMLNDACLLSLRGIRVLCAPMYADVSDKGVAALAGVEMLDLFCPRKMTDVTDAGLAALAGVKFLALHADMPRITPAALAPLLAGGLRKLCMRPSLIDDATRAALRAARCGLVFQLPEWADDDEEFCSTNCMREYWESNLPADARCRYSTWQSLFPGLILT